MMDRKCDQVRVYYQSRELSSDSELQLHLETCERCRELAACDALLGRRLGALPKRPAYDIEELRREVLRAAAHERGPRAWLRSRSRLARLALAVLAALGLSVFALRGGTRVELASIPALAFGGGAYLLAAWMGVRELMAPPSRRIRPARKPHLVLALSFVAVLTPLVVGVMAPEHQLEPAAAFWPRALGCFSFGSVLTGAFLTWLWMLDRRDRRTQATATLTAACAGLVGSFGLQLHCASHDSLHVALGHVGVFAAWVGVFAGVARRRARLG